MAKTPRTQAMRALDARKIAYTVHTFPDTIRDAEQVAATLGLPPTAVFKTLVVVREDDPTAHPFLVLLPANAALDLRRFARAIDVKSVRMASHEGAERLTGLKVGGISALALLNRPFSVYIDASALALPEILVSGGQRGVDLQLRVADLIALTHAQTVEATIPKDAP
ncbi:MAG: aminoacyl-tRNA deacylase [Ktedonobacterales bacterium]|nr:aminoacyl-tRNA deacylase [Ktedonobacterales bacterium]